jgi:Isochorismatase family
MTDSGTVASKPYRWPWHGRFDPSRTALLVVHDGDAAPAAEREREDLARVIAGAAAGGVTIVILPGAAPGESDARNVCELSVRRPHLGGFSGTDLDFLLRHRGIADLILAGFPFELGADCTMRQANDLGYECLALTDCSTGLSPETLAGAFASIQMSGGIFGAVATVSALLELFAGHVPAPQTATNGANL